MKVNKIIKSGAAAYNKNGYRLSSIVKISVPQEARKMGAKTAKKTIIEHKSGEKIFVESMLDKNGKAIQTTHYSSDKPEEMIRYEYKWSKPADSQNDIWGRIIRHFYTKTEESTFDEQNVRYTNLDINTKRKRVNKSIGKMDVSQDTASSEIYSIQNGEKTKGIILKAKKQPNGLYQNTYTDYYGISDTDAAKVLKDKYFHSRFMDNSIMAKNGIAQAAKNQKIHFIPKIFGYLNSENITGSDYSAQSIYLAQAALHDRIPRSGVINILEHECKHFKQWEIVNKYNKGKITDPVRKQEAQQYKTEINNYISVHSDDMTKYYEQRVEREAYAIGQHVERRYARVTKHLKRIFKGASDSTAGA